MAPEILDKKWFQVDDPATVSLKNANTCIKTHNQSRLLSELIWNYCNVSPLLT